jgi:hypothetical protein
MKDRHIVIVFASIPATYWVSIGWPGLSPSSGGHIIQLRVQRIRLSPERNKWLCRTSSWSYLTSVCPLQYGVLPGPVFSAPCDWVWGGAIASQPFSSTWMRITHDVNGIRDYANNYWSIRILSSSLFWSVIPLCIDLWRVVISFYVHLFDLIVLCFAPPVLEPITSLNPLRFAVKMRTVKCVLTLQGRILWP